MGAFPEGLVGAVHEFVCHVASSRRLLQRRGESLAAFDRRCIPAGGVAPRSNTPGILGRRALPTGRLARLDATPDFHHGLLAVERRVSMPNEGYHSADGELHRRSACVHDFECGLEALAGHKSAARMLRSNSCCACSWPLHFVGIRDCNREVQRWPDVIVGAPATRPDGLRASRRFAHGVSVD